MTTAKRTKIPKHFFIHIPETLVDAIIKQLRLSNPPSLEDVETITLWSLSGALSGEIFDDTLNEEGSPKKALKKLEWELGEYIKELRGNKK